MNGNPTVPAREQGASSARSTGSGEERYYVKYHRPRNRQRAPRRSTSAKGAAGRRSARSAPPKHQPRKVRAWSGTRTIPRPSRKDSWAEHRRFLKERRRVSTIAQTPAIESAAGERQCREDTGRRSVARAAIVREPEGTWTTGGSREGSP